MATLRNTQIVELLTTPDELRKLADEMQAFWDQGEVKLWGTELCAKKWVDQDVEIKFMIDQSKMSFRESHSLSASDILNAIGDDYNFVLLPIFDSKHTRTQLEGMVQQGILRQDSTITWHLLDPKYLRRNL